MASVSNPRMNSCKKCGDSTLDHLISYVRNGKTFWKNICKPCRNVQCAERDKACPEVLKKKSVRRQQKIKSQRRGNENTAQFVIQECRRCDKHKGHKNDLTYVFVEESLKKGCTYCGDNSIKMTLDRIDNDLGHTQDNVVPSCLRCNLVRRDMPYAAWLNMVPYIKKAFDKGLFENWVGR